MSKAKEKKEKTKRDALSFRSIHRHMSHTLCPPLSSKYTINEKSSSSKTLFSPVSIRLDECSQLSSTLQPLTILVIVSRVYFSGVRTGDQNGSYHVVRPHGYGVSKCPPAWCKNQITLPPNYSIVVIE